MTTQTKDLKGIKQEESHGIDKQVPVLRRNTKFRGQGVSFLRRTK
jgi:hypothetical protein